MERLDALAVRESKDGKSYFTKIGAAFPNKDGKGYSILLDCMPAPNDGQFKIMLREPLPKDGQRFAPAPEYAKQSMAEILDDDLSDLAF